MRLLTPYCIELLVTKAKEYTDVDFVIGGIDVVGSTQTFPLKCNSYVTGNENILRDFTTYKWYVMACNRLYRIEYLQQNNLVFRAGLLHEDVLFSFQVAISAQAMATVYEGTYIYKVRTTGSITAQRRLKNFEDMLFINKEKFAYMLYQYQNGIYVIPYTYGLNILYEYSFLLVTSRQISQTDRVSLLTALLNAFLSLRTCRYGTLSLKYRFWSIVSRMPARFVLWIIRCISYNDRGV